MEKSTNMKKNYIIILVLVIAIIIVLIVVGLVYIKFNESVPVQLSSEVDNKESIDTSDWITHQDEELGVKFSYLSEWSIQVYNYQDRNYPIVVVTNPAFEQPYGSYGGIRVSLTAEETNLSLDDWFNQESLYNSSNLKSKIEITNREVGDGYFSEQDFTVKEEEYMLGKLRGMARYVKFFKPISLEGFPVTYKLYNFKAGNTIYTFSAFSPTGSQSDSLIQIFDKIIETIEFI